MLSSGETSDTAQTRRTDEAAVWMVVLVQEGEVDAAVSWLPLGEMVVPARTQRGTVLRRLLDGQTADGEGGDVPQVPLDAGERGLLLLIPAEMIPEPVSVQVRSAIVFEVVQDVGATT
jgi:hypothetical protein